MQQDQFLSVVTRDEAERRFRAVLDLRPLPAEIIPLAETLGRVLAGDVVAPVDVPGFDRANVDGFAVQAEDTFGASEDQPRTLCLTGETLATGVLPTVALHAGTASVIATGAVVPRGADAVVMVEHTDVRGQTVIVRRPVTPGANLSFAGTDIGRGETVLRRGERLTSRETGVLAAIGVATVAVVRKPRVAIISTGNELIPPGQPPRPGAVFDSNGTILADAVRELGGEPVNLGIVPDDREALANILQQALAYDVVLLSGGTSKGEGDLCYRVVASLGPPGIVAHGVALKPGKPLCLAAVAVNSGQRALGSGQCVAGGIRPVVILPGFPTSAIFTFHEFVAPVIRSLAGRADEGADHVKATLPLRVNSERGRTEFLLVGLVQAAEGGRWIAYPMGKGSGSVTTFSRADGFVVIGQHTEFVETQTEVDVQLLGRGLRTADLVVIGSHCVGLDYLLSQLHERGWQTKFLGVGSTGGLEAARRGECDLAGIHLLDPHTGVYNRPFLGSHEMLLEGYRRLQGIVFRPGDKRFEGLTAAESVRRAMADGQCVLVNRNRGSGTRVLIDQLLGGARPPGHATEPRSHNAVAAAVAQGRADWGVAIETVARDAHLGFTPLQEEHYDFAVPAARWQRPAVKAFRDVLQLAESRAALERMGFHLP